MQEIVRGIYYENSYPGVTLGALVLPHGLILIDAPLRAEDARAWKTAVSNLTGNALPRMLVNLDSHTDRALGARAMDYTLVAHQKTAQIFRGRPSVFKGQNAESGSEWESQNESMGTRWAVPDITFTQELTLHWGPPDVIIEHHPGPMPGAIWVILPAVKIVFVGDLVMPDQPPFLASADLPLWIEALDILLQKYPDYVIVSGRGGPVELDTVRSQKALLQNILQAMEELARENAAPEDAERIIPTVLANLELSAKMEDQFTQRLHHGLQQYFIHHYRPSENPETD